MEDIVQNQILVPTPGSASVAAATAVCPQCHQSVLPTYYFCPNCGKKLAEAPLSTAVLSQVLLYGFSIVLPIMCYLAIGYWQGIKYMQSADPKVKQIGYIALALLLISSAITFWISVQWINGAIQSAVNTTNIGGLSGF